LKEICLLCGQDIYSPLKEEYENRSLRIREAIRKIIWDKYKDAKADTVARAIITAIEES